MKSSLVYISLFLFVVTCKKNIAQNVKTNHNKEVIQTGKVIKIVDGDTYDILVGGNKTIRVRMEGIDAPERGMAFYQSAKNYLAALCFGKMISLKITGTDNHKRTLAFSYLPDGRELSHEMLKAGFAWHFKKYNSDTDLARLEINARKTKVGLWLDENAVAPWKYRSLKRKKTVEMEQR